MTDHPRLYLSGVVATRFTLKQFLYYTDRPRQDQYHTPVENYPGRVSMKMIEQAVTVLRQGGVIAYPTEAVFGLGCDPMQTSAIQRILDLKQRPAEKGLILVASEFSQLESWLLPLDTEVQQRIVASWPGPVTWVCPAQEHVSPLLRGSHTSLAVRVSAHPMVKQICNLFGGAIVSTSANRSDGIPARTVEEVRAIFADELDLIVEGEVGEAGRPTEIRDALTNAIIRSA